MLNKNLSLRDVRRSYELTQDQVSDYIGLSMRHYREKESGKTPFTQIEIMKMIELFNLDAEEVYTLFYKNALITSFWQDCSLAELINFENE